MNSFMYSPAHLRSHCGPDGRVLVFAFYRAAGIFLARLLEANPSAGPDTFAGIVIVSLPYADTISRAGGPDELKAFKADPANHGKVCQNGLWNYSRHPNYFFEFLLWVGFFIAALGSPWGWITLICPLLMLHFLLNVTGIKLSEEYSLKSRGDAYRAYQRSTSAFVPWFKKS